MVIIRVGVIISAICLSILVFTASFATDLIQLSDGCGPPCSTKPFVPTSPRPSDQGCPPPCSTIRHKHSFTLKIQKALISRGASIKADGKFGPASRKALIKFQKTHNLKPTGKIDSATKKALGLQ